MEKEKDKKKVMINVLKEISEWIICFVIAYILYLLINFFIGTISGVKQVSMYPTAKEGERVIIQRPTIFKKELYYGQIVTFEAPIENDNNTEIAKFALNEGFEKFTYEFMGMGKKSYIKRIIGLEGDHIVISDDGMVYRNDEKLNEIYIKDGWTNRLGKFFDIVVPKNTIFVMGDNRLESFDSRTFGCIPIDKIDGYVITRIWPFDRLGNL